MRIVAHVVVIGALVVLLGALWAHFGIGRAFPDLVVLVAVYLGLTARARLAPSVAGAIAIGYVCDLAMGTPPGAQATVAGTACVLAHLLHRRLLVRGLFVAVLLSFFAGLGAGLATLAIRGYFGAIPAGATGEVGLILGSAILTGIAGPMVFRLCQTVDAWFARTERERDFALEGIAL